MNSLLPVLTIEQWLESAAIQLAQVGIPSARLDAELILAHALEKDRAWLLAHSTEPITTELLSSGSLSSSGMFVSLRFAGKAKPSESSSVVIERASELLNQRLQRIPLAYLIGYKEFYGRNFIVTPDVLIPRPESETMIDVLKELWEQRPGGNVIDVGTGSGCLGITAMLEMPGIIVWLSDISEKALNIARQNARTWALQKQQYYHSDLLSFWYPRETPEPYVNFILANLPYVDRGWQCSPETNHEPPLALFANDNGLALIKKLIVQTEDVLKPDGYLLLEADPEQHTDIVAFAEQYQLQHVRTDDYIVTLQR